MIVSACSLDDLHGGTGPCGQDFVKPHKGKHSQPFARGRLLQDVKNTRRGSKLALDLPFASEIVELWMTYCDPGTKPSHPPSGSAFSTDQLSCILQVASFLQDERSLTDAAESMARLICEHLVCDESADEPCQPDTGTSTAAGASSTQTAAATRSIVVRLLYAESARRLSFVKSPAMSARTVSFIRGVQRVDYPAIRPSDADTSRTLTAALVALPPGPLHLVLQKLPIRAVLALPPALLPVALSARVNLGMLNLASAPLHSPAVCTAITAALSTVTCLLRLDLRATRLGSGPPDAAATSTAALASALSSLPSLRALFLSNTALGSPGVAALAPALTHLTALELLDLSNNRIGPNGIATLSQHLTTLSSLTCMDLALNGLRDAGFRSLSQLLPHLSSLHTLHLSFNAASGKGLAYLSSAISKGLARPEPPTPSPTQLPYPQLSPESTPPNPADPTPWAISAEMSPLRTPFPLQRAATEPSTPTKIPLPGERFAAKRVRLHGAETPPLRPRPRRGRSSRGVSTPPAIPATIPETEALSGVTSTEAPQLPKQGSFPLAMRDSRPAPGSPFRPARSTTFDGDKGSPTSARKPSRLRVLTLRGNCIGSGGDGGEEDELGRPRTGKAFARLEELVLSNCGLGDFGAKGLAAALQRCSRLRTLRLSGNGIEDGGAQALSNAFVTLGTLQRIDFHNNNMGDRGVSAIAESMRMADGLIEADLSSNSFGEHGCAAVAAALPTRMVSLRMCSNAIGDRGGAALGERLAECTALEELWVASAEMGTGGVEALARGISGLPRLLRLRLNYNYIGRGGSAAVAQCVGTLPALRVLELKGCSLKSGMRVIASRLRLLEAIEAVDMSMNQMQSEEALAVQRRLEEQPSLRVLDLAQSREDRERRAA